MRATLFGVAASHPSLAAELMLRHKGVDYRRVDLPTVTHRALLRLLGYPVNELSTMSATVVNTTKIMLIGDFSMFKIIDRVGMTVELVPQLFGATSRYPTGQRGLYAYWRNGSKVIDAVAFRALTGTT